MQYLNWIMTQKSTWLMSTIMQCIGCLQKRRKARNGWCSQNFGHATEAQDDPDDINMIQMNQVFANCSEEDEIYSLTVKEIVEAQKADSKLKHFFVHTATLDKGL